MINLHYIDFVYDEFKEYGSKTRWLYSLSQGHANQLWHAIINFNDVFTFHSQIISKWHLILYKLQFWCVECHIFNSLANLDFSLLPSSECPHSNRANKLMIFSNNFEEIEDPHMSNLNALRSHVLTSFYI